MDAFHGYTHLLAKFGSFQEVHKNTMFKVGCPGRPEGSVQEHVVSRHPWNDPIFFIGLYDEFKASCQVVLVFDKFCIFWSFLGQKRPIDAQTCRNVHMVSEVVQTRHGCLTWACPPACKSCGQSWDFQKNIMFNGECSGRTEVSV